MLSLRVNFHPRQNGCLEKWALAELGLTAYDGYNLTKILNDPCASDADRALASSFFVAGVFKAGGGGVGKILSKGKPSDAPSGTKSIDQVLDRNEVHKIKKQLQLKPDDDVFVTPSGDIIITGQNGKAELLANVEQFRY